MDGVNRVMNDVIGYAHTPALGLATPIRILAKERRRKTNIKQERSSLVSTVPAAFSPLVSSVAMNLGADSKLSQCVDSFIKEVEDDFSAPHQSSFQNYMQKVKRDVQEMEEVHLNCYRYTKKTISLCSWNKNKLYHVERVYMHRLQVHGDNGYRVHCTCTYNIYTCICTVIIQSMHIYYSTTYYII